MAMTDYSPSDGSFLPSSLPFSSSTLPLLHSSAGSLLPPPALLACWESRHPGPDVKINPEMSEADE